MPGPSAGSTTTGSAQARGVHRAVFWPRAIVEPYQGQPSDTDIVQTYVAQGYPGCWVIALGNNGAANMATWDTAAFPRHSALVISNSHRSGPLE